MQKTRSRLDTASPRGLIWQSPVSVGLLPGSQVRGSKNKRTPPRCPCRRELGRPGAKRASGVTSLLPRTVWRVRPRAPRGSAPRGAVLVASQCRAAVQPCCRTPWLLCNRGFFWGEGAVLSHFHFPLPPPEPRASSLSFLSRSVCTGSCRQRTHTEKCGLTLFRNDAVHSRECRPGVVRQQPRGREGGGPFPHYLLPFGQIMDFLWIPVSSPVHVS